MVLDNCSRKKVNCMDKKEVCSLTIDFRLYDTLINTEDINVLGLSPKHPHKESVKCKESLSDME